MWGGLFEPQALGVGFNVIRQLLLGEAGLSLVVGILPVKTLIRSLSLGSARRAACSRRRS